MNGHLFISQYILPIVDFHVEGPGMDKETAEKVSDPFFTTKFTGCGLGMATGAGIVRGILGTFLTY